MQIRWLARVLLIGALLVRAAPAGACAFHTSLPAETAIDRMLASDTVVLVRPDPDDAFAYAIVETLRGSAEGVTPPFLIDSTTRRRLARNGADAVLLAHRAGAGWTRLAYVDARFRTVIETVQRRAVEWIAEPFHSERFALAVRLHDDADPQLRTLALQEIDRVPYGMLQTMDVRVPANALVAALWTRQGYAYQPIRVLLLGLTGEDVARAEVRAFIDRVQTWDRAEHLGAFATALIELDGLDGVVRLEQGFLADPGQPLDKLESIVEAMAIHHGLAERPLRTSIADALLRFVAMRPDGAGAVARHFESREDWGLAAALLPVSRNPDLVAASTYLAVSGYVAKARARRTMPGGAGLLLPRE